MSPTMYVSVLAASGGANSSSKKLSLAAVNAAPFVPGSTLQDQGAPRSFAAPGFGQRELPQPKPSLFGMLNIPHLIEHTFAKCYANIQHAS